MFLINYMEAMAFSMLAYDASKGRAKHVSLQSCVALTLALALSAMNLPRANSRKIYKLAIVFVGCCFGTLASWRVAKDTQANNEDDLNLPGLSSRGCKAVIYVAAVVMGFLSLMVACRFSLSDMWSFMKNDNQSTVCTFQNFLHAFALLPQLVLCRRQGFVAPAAVRFLCLLGTKHLYEFVSDAYVSYQHYLRGRLHLHEFSFMSGDFVAALILLDFLYLVLVDERTLLLLLGCKEMELHDEEAATDDQPSRWQKFLQCIRPYLESSKQRQKIFSCAGAGLMLLVGTYSGLLNVYASLGAAALFGALRLAQMYQDSLGKAEKCGA
ncbi:unnamed protein product [Effrenium voratum]|uniref:Uncharacterized protein n=1 Tax=Effrenium voratum TaxID=2562239 RepID=A0AA36IZK2_9DINO|nr:unnamed protein product [Effrenium voratum]